VFKGEPLIFGKIKTSKKTVRFSAFKPYNNYTIERNLYMTLLFGAWTVYTIK